ncbi:MAG: hypothetical protein Q8N69_02340 [bacterium]|nr:hypothetical protein [bacterium]
MDMQNNTPTMNILPPPKVPFWKHLWFKIAIAAILMIILGFGIALASRLWDPLWNPFRPSPETVLQKMLENMKGITSLHTDADINTEGSGMVLDIKFSDDTDSSDPQNSKSAGNTNLKIEYSGIQFLADAEYVLLGKDIYLKLNKIPAIPFLPVDLNVLKDKWIKIPMENFEGSEGLSEIIQDLNSNGDAALIKEELPDDKIRNVETYHFIIGFDGNKFADLIKRMLTAGGESELAQEQITQIVKNINGLDAEFWVGKRDYLLYRIKMGAKALRNGAEAVFDISVDLSDFNKPVSVSPPSDYTSAEDLMMQFAPMLQEVAR